MALQKYAWGLHRFKRERGKRKGREIERREHSCWEALPGPRTPQGSCLSLSCPLSRSGRGSQAEIPFPGSSQGRAGGRWDVWAGPTCSLTAASFHAGSLGMTEAAAAWEGGSWGGQGSFVSSGRASQLSEILSFSK